MIETSGHLPECCRNDAFQMEPFPCICDRLRACERRAAFQRGVDDARLYGAAIAAAYAAGLDAARDAVAATRGWFTHEYPEDAGHGMRPVLLLDDALAAIDALRGEA